MLDLRIADHHVEAGVGEGQRLAIQVELLGIDAAAAGAADRLRGQIGGCDVCALFHELLCQHTAATV